MTARGDARKRQASPISMHSDAHNGLTEAERDALREAVDHDETCPASGEDNDTHGVFAAVARIKAEAVQAERELIGDLIAAQYELFDSGLLGYDEGLAALDWAERIARGEGR